MALQENVGRLEGVSVKLRQEKTDLVHEISEIKQEAHQEIIKVEARLKCRIHELETANAKLAKQLEDLQQDHQSLQVTYTDAQVTITQHASRIHKVYFHVATLHRTGRMEVCCGVAVAR